MNSQPVIMNVVFTICLILSWISFGCGTVTIEEGMTPGTVVYTFPCSSSTATFSFDKNIGKDLFNITQTGPNNTLSVAKTLDFENSTDFHITRGANCLYQVDLIMKISFDCNGVITEESVNFFAKDEFKPYFCSINCSRIEHVKLDVPEETAVQSSLLEVLICDDDVNPDSSIPTTAIQPQNYINIVTNSNKINFKLASTLDYESINTALDFYATLNGIRLLNISLNVTDSDDQGLSFTKQVYHCHIPENFQPGVTNCSVLVKDLDKGINVGVDYELLSVTPVTNGLFDLLPNGSFQLQRNLDRENIPVYYLALKGFQKDRPIDKVNYSTVLVTVTDADDNLPKMGQPSYNTSVIENSPVGTIVCQVSATDLDEGINAQFNYAIVGVNAYFKVDKTTGSIQVKSPIDRESIKTNPIKFKVKAVPVVNTKRTSNESDVTVYILDENDNSPKFLNQNSMVTINKTHQPNSYVYKVNASDPDESQNGQITYKIEQTDAPFTIDSTTGVITLTRTLNETFDPHYSIVVIAGDNAAKVDDRRASLLVVRINVLDDNIHAPVFKQDLPSKVNVSEDVKIGTTLLELKATDKDPTDTLEFTLENGYEVFAVQDNYLKTNGSLDRETRADYDVKVKVTDKQHVVSKSLLIHVTDVNDNGPIFDEEQYYFNITEEIINQNVGDVSANDADEGLNGDVVYEIDYGNKWSKYFRVDKTNGHLSMIAAVDRESLSTGELVSFLVFAYDRGQPELMNSTTVTIDIIDINDNGPIFEANQRSVEYELNEGSRPQVFHKATAIDHDGNGNNEVFYTIKEPSLHGIVTVTQSGNVSISKTLNFTNANDCNNTCIKFTIIAYNRQQNKQNHGGQMAQNSSQSVTLHITDVNEKPYFNVSQSDTNLTIPERNVDHEHGKIIQSYTLDTYRAFDNDVVPEFKDVIYTLNDPSGKFKYESSTGSLIQIADIDFDPPSNETNFKLILKASNPYPLANGSESSVSLEINVTVTGVDDNAPRFTTIIYWCQLNEGKAGPFNCSTAATDVDGDNLTYALVNPDQATNLAISSSTGQINATTEFDFDKMDSKEIKLNISVTDTNHTSYATVIVKILDINDELPAFKDNHLKFEIKENMKSVSYFVGEVDVTDADSEFTLSIDNCRGKCIGCFKITEKGDVMALKEFDFEDTKHNHTFICDVAACNGAPCSQKSITINVIDVNDNTPTFGSSLFLSSVNETASKGTFVTQMIAHDNDVSTKFNKVSYSINAGNELGLFSIDPVNGSVYTQNKVDDHYGENVTLMIKACDNGVPPLCSFSNLGIKINNLNINEPVFTGLPYHVQHKEDNGNISIISAHAVDTDGEKLQFKVVNMTSTFFFKDNVLYANELDAEQFRNTSGRCYVEIEVSDGIHIVKTTVVIMVIDVNDNTPVLVGKGQKGYNFKVDDTTSVGTRLTKLNANDRDISNDGFTFVLQGGKGDIDIDKSTGEVTVINPFGHNGQMYNMTITVLDHGDPPQSDSSTLIVNVVDTFPKFHFNNPLEVNLTEKRSTEKAHLAVVGNSVSIGQLEYAIISDNRKEILNIFNFNNTNGLLIIRNKSNPLDYEQKSKFEFTVLAKDHGVFEKSAATNVTINVIDINEKPSIVSSKDVIMLEENSPSNTFIARVIAQDPDVNSPFDKLTLTVSNSNTFQIDQHGNISVKSSLLKASNYSLKVTVTDGGNLTSSTTIDIIVPKVEAAVFNFTIKENRQTPYIIKNLTANVRGLDVEYSIIQSKYSGIFSIANNELSITETIDREVVGSITVDIQGRHATSGILLRQLTINIKVDDVNDCVPTFQLATYSITIDDLVKSNSVIATIPAVDKDIDANNKNLSYSLTGTDVSGLFSIDKTGNVLVDDATGLQTKTYNVVIHVTDGLFHNTANLVITVVDTNDHSPACGAAIYKLNITETNSTSIDVGYVLATDGDTGRNGNITYSITSGNDGSVFQINTTNGLIKTVKAIDRESTDIYQMIVTARDHGNSPRQGTCTVVVEVMDVNDNFPQLQVTSNYEGSILENSDRNVAVKVVPEITALDTDSGVNGIDGLVFTLNDSSSPFCMKRVGSRATVYVCGDIDREQQEYYYLEVIVQDSNASKGSHQISVPLVIHVLDENDEPPTFTLNSYRFNVSEDSRRSASVGQVVVTDKDLHGEVDVKFDIAKGSDGKFHIDTYTGIIYVVGAIDREMKDQYELYVVANDGANMASTQVLLQVTDVNDNPPLFTAFVIDVEENKTGIIFNTTVYDRDDQLTNNSKVSFSTRSIDCQGAKSTNFAITNDGKLRIQTPLDREKSDRFEVTIIATDNGTPALSSSMLLYINVLDINDNGPVICVEDECDVIQTDIHITENTKDREIVKILDARDPDAGLNATITFTTLSTSNSSTVLKYFNLDINTGVIRVNNPKALFDEYKKGSITSNKMFFEIIARDGGATGSKILIVNVHVDILR